MIRRVCAALAPAPQGKTPIVIAVDAQRGDLLEAMAAGPGAVWGTGFNVKGAGGEPLLLVSRAAS